MTITLEAIRAAGGIVHSDGNIFFRDISMLQGLAGAAPAAVAGPANDLEEVDLPDVEDMAHSAVQEALSCGVNHDVFHRWMRAVMDKTVEAMTAAPVAAPALEAPAAPAVPLKATPEMRAAFRRAYRGGAYREREIWGNRVDYALDQMLAAAPQAPRLGEDALHLLHRLLSNQHTLTGPEFRAELEKIVAEESARHAAAPQAPAAPILGDAERLAAARQDKSLADYWRNRVAGLAEEFTTAEAALYLADRIVADLYDLPQAGVARPAAPAAPAVDAKAHDWRENASYGGEICAECGAAKGSRRGNAPCAWPPEPLDVCTDPYNCARCKAHPNHRKGLEHAGISRPRSAAQAKEGGAPVADAAPLDVCTDPYNCARCKTHPAHRGDMHHAGISRIGGSA